MEPNQEPEPEIDPIKSKMTKSRIEEIELIGF
jgi:hypothetical protein